MGKEKERVSTISHPACGHRSSREGTGEFVLLKSAAILWKLAEQDGASRAALFAGKGSRPFLTQKDYFPK